MGKSAVGWTDWTTNFYTWSCTKISAGCANCYAIEMARQFKQHSGKELPEWDGQRALADFRKMPHKAVCFINDMSDTYHEHISLAHIHMIHQEIKYTRPDATCLILTKRIERALELAPRLVWPKNLWLGTSIENQRVLNRIDLLRQTPAQHRFLSLEPLLEDLGPLDLSAMEWVIVGGESGPSRRRFDPAWARNIRVQCEEQQVPLFFKQGSAFKPGQDRLLDGKEWNGFPPEFTPKKFMARDEFEVSGKDQLPLF